MELHMCGFNAHRQLGHKSDDELIHFREVCRSPDLRVRCALWSSTVVEDDGVLIHYGFRSSGADPAVFEGPPTKNIKIIFGDTAGVLGALTGDGYLYVYQDEPGTSQGPELKRHHFDEESFIQRQNLSIEDLAITDNGEVCVITNSGARGRSSSGCTPKSADHTPRFTFSAPTAKLEIHTFPSFEKFVSSEPPTSNFPLYSSVVSLVASATGFAILTSNGEVLTFGSALHPQVLGRTPTPSNPAMFASVVPFLGGIPIRKISVGGWLAAAVSEDHDLYIWGGQASDAHRIAALPNGRDGEEVRLVDIDGGVDVIDVGVGCGHVLALTSDGDLWAAGKGDFGQLGTGGKAFEESWVKVKGQWEGKGRIVEIGCGVWCSWVIVDTKGR